jgi:hypothetical protein
MLALSRKLCPFFSLMVMVACGKKMTEPGTVTTPHIENQSPTPTLVIEIAEHLQEYRFGQSGDILLPDRLIVNSGDATGKTISITYNISPDDPELYEFKCVYKGVSSTSMPVQKCVDIDGSDMGNVTNGSFSFPMAEGYSIKFESSSYDLKAEAIYDVNWK